MRAVYAFIFAISALWALARNAHAQLYVTNRPAGSLNSGLVGEYNATTGAMINASFITGLNSPLALGLLGNSLFVSDIGNGTVGEYDAKTGAAINANFITGLSAPFGLAVKSKIAC